MVHALQKIRGLLRPAGILIDIHPNGEPPPIYVHSGGATRCVGWIQEESDYVCYHEADDALREVVRRGWFTWQRRRTFAFTTHADSLGDLRDHLACAWKDALIDDLVARRIEEALIAHHGGQEIVVQEVVKIARLIALP